MAARSAHGSWRIPATSAAILIVLLTIGVGPARAGDSIAPAGSGARLADLLSSPLPGTQARTDSDLAARLEHSLRGFDGIEAATVIASRSPDTGDDTLHVTIQLRTAPEFTPTAPWLQTIRVFAVRVVPHIEPDALTVVDSSGRILLDAGVCTVAPAAPPPTGLIDETFHFEPWWLLAAAALGFGLVLGGVFMHRSMRSADETSTESSTGGPFDFLRTIPVERIARLLAEERPEVTAAVLAAAPDEVTARLSRHDNLPDLLPPCGQPDPVIVAALARVLRERLGAG